MRCTTTLGYPADWKVRSLRIREWAGWKCDECKHGPRHHNPLTVHHKDGDPQNNTTDNLQVLCASCHLRAQKSKRLISARQPAQMDLWEGDQQ